jgi:hypothetical protein
MAASDYLLLIMSKIQDTASKLDESQILDGLQAAVNEYSTTNPREKIATVTGDGVAVTFALPADFIEGLSGINAIEYPVDKQAPEYLDANEDYGLYRDPATGVLKLRFFSLVLGSGVKAYVTYTRDHHVLAAAPSGETSADTVPRTDRDAVACLAASNCCLMLAAYYAQTSDPTIGADAVDYQAKSETYLKLAEIRRKEYNQALGLADGTMAASARLDLDQNMQWGYDRFFHSRLGR